MAPQNNHSGILKTGTITRSSHAGDTTSAKDVSDNDIAAWNMSFLTISFILFISPSP